MTKQARPLSPHLQIYKWQMTSVLSILHRGTGIFLSFGTILFCLSLLGIADRVYRLPGQGQAYGFYGFVKLFYASPIGILLLMGWSYSLMYHSLNGIRHLLWDAGFGLDIPTATKTGWAVVVLSIIFTIAIWVVALRGLT